MYGWQFHFYVISWFGVLKISLWWIKIDDHVYHSVFCWNWFKLINLCWDSKPTDCPGFLSFNIDVLELFLHSVSHSVPPVLSWLALFFPLLFFLLSLPNYHLFYFYLHFFFSLSLPIHGGFGLPSGTSSAATYLELQTHQVNYFLFFFVCFLTLKISPFWILPPSSPWIFCILQRFNFMSPLSFSCFRFFILWRFKQITDGPFQFNHPPTPNLHERCKYEGDYLSSLCTKPFYGLWFLWIPEISLFFYHHFASLSILYACSKKLYYALFFFVLSTDVIINL